MEEEKIKCPSCHKLVDIPFDKQAVRCPYCGVILIAYRQELPHETKNSSILENKVEDK